MRSAAAQSSGFLMTPLVCCCMTVRRCSNRLPSASSLPSFLAAKRAKAGSTRGQASILAAAKFLIDGLSGLPSTSPLVRLPLHYSLIDFSASGAISR